MGLGDFLQGAADAVSNVGKGALWAANPTHWDDVAEGVGKAGQYVAENPGQVWDTGFEVGRSMLKEQLKPQNLAITAGLVALTVATGGAAAPALAAEVGEVGLAGAEGIAAGTAALKGAQALGTAAKGVESVGTVAKAAEAGGTAVKAAETAAEVGEVATEVGRGAKFLSAADKALGAEPGRFAQGLAKVTDPLANSRMGMASLRETAASKILAGAGEEAPSLARQATAALVQGGGKGLGAPTQLEGISSKVYQAQKMAWRGSQVERRIGQAESIKRDVEVAADPMKAVEKQASAAIDAQSHPAAYTDIGQTTTDIYGGGQAVSPYGEGGGGGAAPPGAGPPSGAAPPNMPPSMPPSQVAEAEESTAVRKPKLGGGAWHPSGQHFWEGPRSQWAGGIGFSHDWRPVDPLRSISSPTVGQARRYKAYKSDMRAYNAQGARAQGDLNEQGAPSNFSPEVPKSGMNAISVGQQPLGALNPGVPRDLEAGPTVRTAGPPMSKMYAGDVRTYQKPIAAVGPGEGTSVNSGVIDADSWSPEDYKFDNSGQGYLDFANTMGTAAVGQQPNTQPSAPQPAVGAGNPVYAQGTRAQRRRSGQSTTGMNPDKLGSFF